jgi:transglutaminase superfamily protein
MRLWVGRLRRMRASDYARAIEVVGLAVWVEVALRVMPFSWLLERLNYHSRHATVAGDEYQRLLRYVAVAYDVLPFPATCLRRSVVLYGLLGRRGVPSRVCFGVAKSGPALDAHAWVECDGVTRDSGSLRFNELAAPAEELPHVVNEQLRFL